MASPTVGIVHHSGEHRPRDRLVQTLLLLFSGPRVPIWRAIRVKHGESVITFWVRLRQEGYDGDWQPYERIQANSPLEAAESLYGGHLATIGNHFQVRALVKRAGQSAATALYDRIH